MEIAQSDAAAAMDWYRSETWKAYERPESEVTGNESDNYERRAPGTAGMRHGVRYQIYESKDGFVLFQASEREFWQNFCAGVDRMDLFERWPGARSTPTTPAATASCRPSCGRSSRPAPRPSGSPSATSTTRRSPR